MAKSVTPPVRYRVSEMQKFANFIIYQDKATGLYGLRTILNKLIYPPMFDKIEWKICSIGQFNRREPSLNLVKFHKNGKQAFRWLKDFGSFTNEEKVELEFCQRHKAFVIEKLTDPFLRYEDERIYIFHPNPHKLLYKSLYGYNEEIEFRELVPLFTELKDKDILIIPKDFHCYYSGFPYLGEFINAIVKRGETSTMVPLPIYGFFYYYDFIKDYSCHAPDEVEGAVIEYMKSMDANVNEMIKAISGKPIKVKAHPIIIDREICNYYNIQKYKHTIIPEFDFI